MRATPLAQSTVPDVSLGTLRTLVADLRREHPHAGPRLDHAAFIATFRDVERGTSPGLWWVGSETDPSQQYLVRAGTCTCQDFARRGEQTPCKHLLSVEIIQRLERLELDRDPRADTPIALELTDAAYALLASLGEPADLDLQCASCHGEPALAAHRDRLGVGCIARELYPDDDPAA